MRVLALDTATAATAVAVVAFGPGSGRPRTLAAWERVDPRAHGERLVPMIHEALAEAGARPGDLTAVVSGDGPGPFTGMRVGLVTAAAMAQALEVPAYGVCSLDGIGAATAPGRSLVTTDARRREVYWAIYADGERVTEPAVDPPAVVAARASAYGVDRACGEGADRYREVLGFPVARDRLYPAPVLLAAAAHPRIESGAAGESLTPRYLRRADAAASHPPKPVTR